MESLMRVLLLSIAFALGLASVAMAHEPRTGPHGGALVDAGSYHIEVVAKGEALDIFVSDANDKPLSTIGFKALAIFSVEGKSIRVMLEPSTDGQKLYGMATNSLGRRPKGAVQLTAPDGKTATGRVN
jgi:hypothetical protein